jgi:hypothetical protein
MEAVPDRLYPCPWSSLKMVLLSVALTSVKYTYRCDCISRVCGVSLDVGVLSVLNSFREILLARACFGKFIRW